MQNMSAEALMACTLQRASVEHLLEGLLVGPINIV
jgi:hypothetical protein